MATNERGVCVDGTPKALRDVEVRSLHYFRVESGEGARKGERGVHLQRNEGVHHPLRRTESKILDKDYAIEHRLRTWTLAFMPAKNAGETPPNWPGYRVAST
jgi:hypothetical protein